MTPDSDLTLRQFQTDAAVLRDLTEEARCRGGSALLVGRLAGLRCEFACWRDWLEILPVRAGLPAGPVD